MKIDMTEIYMSKNERGEPEQKSASQQNSRVLSRIYSYCRSIEERSESAVRQWYNGTERTGSDGVDSNAVSRQVARHRQRHTHYRSFARCVCHLQEECELSSIRVRP